MFTHEELLRAFRKGMRNGNWRKLSRVEKALYMASMWYARVRGAIMNETLVGDVIRAGGQTKGDKRRADI